MKSVIKVAIVLASGLLLGLLGMLLGAMIGGNYATGFQFNGVQGYEAAGQVGFIIGAALGVVVSWKKIVNK